MQDKYSSNFGTNFTNFKYPSHVTYYFYCLQLPDRDDEMDESSDQEEPEFWEDVLMEDLLCDVESSVPCPEPYRKQTRTQKLTALVQWLVYFILMWQSLCKLSDNGLEWLLQFLFQFLCGISHTLSTPAKFISLFICPRERSACHVVSICVQ